MWKAVSWGKLCAIATSQNIRSPEQHWFHTRHKKSFLTHPPFPPSLNLSDSWCKSNTTRKFNNKRFFYCKWSSGYLERKWEFYHKTVIVKIYDLGYIKNYTLDKIDWKNVYVPCGFFNCYLSSSKKAGLKGDWKPDFGDAGAVLYLVMWVDDKLIDDGYGCIYITKYTNVIYIRTVDWNGCILFGRMKNTLSNSVWF